MSPSKDNEKGSLYGYCDGYWASEHNSPRPEPDGEFPEEYPAWTLEKPSGSDSLPEDPGKEFTYTAQEPGSYKFTAKCGNELTVDVVAVEVKFNNVWERNLDPLDENDNLAGYDKCIAVEHDNSGDDAGELDLEDEDYLKIIPDDLTWDDIDGAMSIDIEADFHGSASMNDAVLDYNDTEPGDHEIYGFGLELKCDGSVMDRLVVVIYDPDTRENYEDWVEEYNADPAWVDDLPPVYSSLGGDDNTEDPEPDDCNNDEWRNSVNEIDNNYHYDAEWEMRSRSTGLMGSGHGHQVCYDDDGNLITPDGTEEALAACGTADYEFARDILGNSTHVSEDVWPFIRAAQLDGNPIEGQGTLGPSQLSDPLIRLGDNLQDYFDRRPPHTDDTVESGSCIE